MRIYTETEIRKVCAVIIEAIEFYKLEKKAEGLFDGRFEIVLIRPSVTPVLDANGNLQTANVAVEQYIYLDKIKRKSIREMRDNHALSIFCGGTFTNEWKPVNVNLPLVIYEYDKGGSFEIALPTVKFKIGPVEVTTPGTFKYNVSSRSNPYLVESVSRNFYAVAKNTRNPGIDPGQYNGWCSWGLQNCNITLVTENNWIN